MAQNGIVFHVVFFTFKLFFRELRLMSLPILSKYCKYRTKRSCIFNIGGGVDNIIVLIYNLYKTFCKISRFYTRWYEEFNDSKQ